MTARILVVDDEPLNVDLLCQELDDLGYAYDEAYSGAEALAMLAQRSFDTVLLDMMMPGVSGLEVLEELQSQGRLAEIPVIVISALDDMDHVTRSLELGAEDYLFKPVNEKLLKARLAGALEKKRLRDMLAEQLEITRRVFGKYVPERVAEDIVAQGGQLAPVQCEATVMFCDLAGFTQLAETLAPPDVLAVLSAFFSAVLPAVDSRQGTVNEFFGDGMLVTFNVPLLAGDHARRGVECALEILDILGGEDIQGHRLSARIGVATGNVVAGNIDTMNRLNYTVLGDTVNLAARLQQMNKQMNSRLLISEATMAGCGSDHGLEPVTLEVRGKTNPVRAYKLGA